jgi:uncharacterized damage-inducible protein DinB
MEVAIMTSDHRNNFIDQIKQLPEELGKAVAELSDEQLDTPYREGGWTVRQVVHHLVDSHINAMIRMKLLITENYPTLRPYLQEEWAKLPDTNKMPVQTSLAILKGLHTRWGYLLERLPEDVWIRKGFHPEDGEVVLEGLLRSYANHGNNHLKQITVLKENMGW